MSTRRPLRIMDTDDGGAIFAVPYTDDADMASPITQQLSASAESPVPTSQEGPGPAPRITDQFTPISGGTLRRIMMSGAEASDAIRTRRDELYRNEFPRLEPRYAEKCDACDAEYDAEQDECGVCGSTDLSPPDPEKKREATRLFESVNAAGQSLRDIAKRAEEDQWTAGVSTLVVEHEYYQATGDGALYDRGEIYREEPTGLHRADPFALRPIVDEDGQPGGHWYVCPLHRDTHYEDAGRCPQCNAELREAHFVEDNGHTGERQYYLRQEVITWAYAQPRLHGLDGLAPSVHVWLKQAILQMMDRYAGAFYDPEADRLPNQFMILHTSNPDSWEDEMAKARDDSDRYRSPIFTNEYSPQDTAQPEVQVIDAMPDELLGQSEETKSTFKSDIRQAFGISDVHDSDLEDAGGLNNEGLQLEVTDRSLASQMNDYRHGWLDTLMKRLGFDGWRISFLPEPGTDAKELQDNLRAAAFVKQAGGDARIQDGSLVVDDFDVELDDSDDPPSLSGAPNLPGVGSPVPGDGGGAPGGAPGGGGGTLGGGGGLDTSALQAEERALEHVERKLRAGMPVTDVDMKGAPVYATRNDVPPNVQNRIESALEDHDFSVATTIDTPTLQDVFRKSLTQPQGWSIDSIATNLRKATDGVDRDTARTTAQTEATAILNEARAKAVRELEQETGVDVLHYWDGPDDEDTTDMCTWLKEQTNPEYGGDPVSMDELEQLQRTAIEKYGDGQPYAGSVRSHVLHPNERHTHRSILASQV